MKTVGMTQLREVVQRLTENGQHEVSNALLYEAFGLTDEAAKARLRRRLTDMVQRSELERCGTGVYRYNPKAQPQRNGEMYARVWRLVRAKEPGWSWQDLATRTRASYTTVSRYCGWLLEEGYIARYGKAGNTCLYRATIKAREQRETPYPPIAIKDPFEAERSACCRLVRLMMERNPYQVGVRDKIIKELSVMNNRFPKEEARG